MGEGQDTNNLGRGGDRLTIAEAAALLGVHKNTVRNRIKDGYYRAEMVQTERGPTYLIERESLLTNLNTNTLSSASQELVGPQAMEFVQELLRPFVSEVGEVREELGAERARRQIAEERTTALEAELEALREAQESPQTVEEELDRARGAPLRYGRGSARHTEALVAEVVRRVSDKALRMLKHMRKQILRQPAPYVVVRGAAISIGVDPGGSECDGLVNELLRDGHLQRYPSPSLTAYGLYRLTDLGISAADEG